MITKIPFKIVTIDSVGFHLLAKMYINGKVANVVIDTGASQTAFDASRIAKYVGHSDFDNHDKLSSGLGTNNMKSQLTILKKIRVGDLEIMNYKTVLLDLSHVNHSYAQVGLKPIEGVLGNDILLKYQAVIEYDKKILRLKYLKAKK